jgi:hypothetical protein
MAHIQPLFGGTGFPACARILPPPGKAVPPGRNIVAQDMVLKVENYALSSARNIKGNLESNDYFPVGADPCVRPELRAHTQVRPYNYVFFYCGSLERGVAAP